MAEEHSCTVSDLHAECAPKSSRTARTTRSSRVRGAATRRLLSSLGRPGQSGRHWWTRSRLTFIPGHTGCGGPAVVVVNRYPTWVLLALAVAAVGFLGGAGAVLRRFSPRQRPVLV